jgi:hypothetical protein
MKSSAIILGVLLSGMVFSNARAADDDCKFIRENAASLLEQCGGQIRSFALIPASKRWRSNPGGFHGGFAFSCVDIPDLAEVPLLERFGERTKESPCPDEPKISGSFISPEDWEAGSKDGAGILRVALSAPMVMASLPLPTAGCPAFDVSIGGMAGRATCIIDRDWRVIVAGFGEKRIAFVLFFSQQDKSLEMLKDRTKMLLAKQFMIERGTGDAALLRWMK